MSTTAEQNWSVGRLLEWTSAFFREKKIDTPRLEAEVLLAHVLACGRIDLYAMYDAEVTPADRTRYRELVRERTRGKPVAYLVGHKEFFSLEFVVDPTVLIPRPETEVLVSEALALLPVDESARIVDLGTGSGIIAVTLAVHRPLLQVVAVDISEDALAIARQNAEKHGVSDRIEFRHGDLLGAADDLPPFDAVVSNPPYIRTQDIDELDADVRDFEPRRALDGGNDGFIFLRRIIQESPKHLVERGWVALEFGAAQEATLKSWARECGEFPHVRLVDDDTRRPRILVARRALPQVAVNTKDDHDDAIPPS